ncbi:MAG: ABC transporter permease [Deltaproteobacteria bacterium]|nr:ABC transporter permease [Deltaproteobacteria bacterium]
MRSRQPSLSESRWLRWALLAFPAWARERHGDALLETWEDLHKTHNLRAVKIRAAWDLLRNGCLLRLEETRNAERPTVSSTSLSALSRGPHLETPLLHRSAGLRASTRLETAGRDLVFAIRKLRREPAFTLTAVLIVGLGIGANTTIFSIVNAALFKPLPYERPEDLVRIYTSEEDTVLPVGTGYLEYLELQERRDLFEETAFHADPTFLTLEWGGSTQTVMGEYTSVSFFRVLGLSPALGRDFLPEEDTPGASEAVGMISHSAWRKRFGGDPSILGRRLQVNGIPITIVGVGPKGFQGTLTGIDSELYLPWGTATQADRSARAQLEDRRIRELFVLARLQPGVTREAAQSALTVMAANLAADHPASNEDRTLQVYAASEVRSHPLLDRALIPVSAFFMVLMGLVLTVSISNLANLLLAKASARQREMVLRLALGARRGQLVRQLLVESTLLAAGGGLVGLAIALLLPKWLVATELPLPIQLSFDFHLDWRVLSFAILLSLATGLLFGIMPALSASRAAFSKAMGGSPAWRFGQSSRFNLRDALIVVQVAVSTLLLAGGALFLHSLLQSQNADPGFETEKLALATFDAEQAGYRDEESARHLWNRYRQQVETTAGPGTVALTSRVPLGFLGSQQIGISSHGDLLPGERPERQVELSIVSPNYWQVMDIPLLRGRGLRETDVPAAPRVAVVSQTMAQELWGPSPAIGRRLGVEGRGLVEVVGVVADTKIRRLSETARPLLYLPFEQNFEPWMNLVVATDRPAAMKETLRQELASLNPKAALLENKTMTEHLGLVLYPAKVAGAMLMATGLLALLLASFGLYGMIALAIARRTREVGIRAALGASRPRLIRMVVGEALRVVAIGLVFGLVLATLALQPLRGLLYGISPFDPISFAAVALVLGLVTLVASYLPARRTARIDVVSALKSD